MSDRQAEDDQDREIHREWGKYREEGVGVVFLMQDSLVDCHLTLHQSD